MDGAWYTTESTSCRQGIEKSNRKQKQGTRSQHRGKKKKQAWPTILDQKTHTGQVAVLRRPVERRSAQTVLRVNVRTTLKEHFESDHVVERGTNVKRCLQKGE
jgi:hypothetical protein